MSLGARVGRAILWGQAGRLAEAIFFSGFSLILARALGPASYGLYALGMSLAGICAFLALLGIGPETLGRFLPELVSSGGPGRAGELLLKLLAIRGAAILALGAMVIVLHRAIGERLHIPLFIGAAVLVLLMFAARSILDLLTYFSSGLLDLRRVAAAKLATSCTAPSLFLIFWFRHAPTANAAWLAIAGGSLSGILVLGLPFLRDPASSSSESALPLRRILAFGMFAWATNFFVFILGDNTDMPNRMLLNDRLSQAIVWARRHMKGVAILFLDLDGFKHINDSLGHSIGDKLLQSVAKRLVDCVRASDTVSRQGGDEFVVLLSEMEHPEDASITARRMLDAVAEAHSIDQHDLHITSSMGVSVCPDDGMDAETLIKNADTAMYQSRENGHRGFKFFKPAMNVRAVERQSIEGSLRRALERQEFAVHYQPKVNLRTGEIVGAEALLRWTHPTRGLVPPAQFIPVAEDCGLILSIGNWVRREVCKQAQNWAAAGLPQTSIAVNISAMEFRDDNFLESVFAILSETGLDPKYLELELTESVLMKRTESAASILQALQARGVQIAVDDFGTGYSSLSCLRQFPVDALKIDQSFVRQITTAPEGTSIVPAIIGMGQSMKLRVVAEGVETQQELAFLQAHQCDEAQGYYFSRPVLPQQFALLLQNGIPEAASAVHRSVARLKPGQRKGVLA
jgi:diguanylate cyclase (GGDEF)-like protein